MPCVEWDGSELRLTTWQHLWDQWRYLFNVLASYLKSRYTGDYVREWRDSEANHSEMTDGAAAIKQVC